MPAQVTGEFTREILALHIRDDLDKAFLSVTLPMALCLERQFLFFFLRILPMSI